MTYRAHFIFPPLALVFSARWSFLRTWDTELEMRGPMPPNSTDSSSPGSGTSGGPGEAGESPRWKRKNRREPERTGGPSVRTGGAADPGQETGPGRCVCLKILKNQWGTSQ